MARSITCNACGAVVSAGKNGTFNLRHHCPHKGANAIDTAKGYHPCPTHGTLVWVIGPYSAFRACGERSCTAGRGGKPHRYFAARADVQSHSDAAIERIADTDSIAEESTDIPDTANTHQDIQHPMVTPHADALNLKALGSLGDAIAAYVEQRARTLASELIVDAVSKLDARGPSEVHWTVNEQPFARIDGTHHKALPRLLKLYAAGFRNFLVVGPAGSGKTTLARDLARALTADFASVSCTGGMSESALTGRAMPNLTTGETAFQSTDFVRCYEAGGVFLLDEIDAADPNVMLVINSALSNGHMPLPNRTASPSATRHADSIIMCAANTWGTGADRQYVGRNQLDAAFLDRFVGCTIEVDYDRDLESALVGDANVCARVWTVRDKVADLKLRRVVGTRFLMAVARLVRGAGETVDQALTACTMGWTPDERSKVGIRGAA